MNTTTVRKKYTREDYAPFIGGKNGANLKDLKPLPNAEEVEPLAFLNNLAAGGHMMEPVWGYTMLPDGSRPQWSQCFLTNTSNMGSSPDGGGYAVTYGGSRWVPDPEAQFGGRSIDKPIVRRFAICKHEKEMGAGANPSRGWHPGHCKLCGLDMSIDSGD